MAYDNSSSTSGSYSLTLSWSHTCSTSANRYLAVTGGNVNTPLTNISSVTYNSVSLSSLWAQNNGFARSEGWRLIAPATGTNTVLVTYASSSNSAIAAGATSFTGINQTTPERATAATATGTSTSPSVTATSLTSGDDVFAQVTAVSAGTTTEAETLSWEHNNIDGWGDFAAEYATAAGSTKAMAWTLGSSVTWAAGAVGLAPAGGSGHTVTIGQATETDTAQVITINPIHRLLGQVTETDLAQAFSIAKALVIGQPAETDIAQTVTAIIGLTIEQTNETDTAQSLTSAKTLAITQANEADTAQTFTIERGYNLGQVTETDLAQSLSFTKNKAIGQANETDTALHVTGVPIIVVIEQALEIDEAFLVVAVVIPSPGLWHNWTGVTPLPGDGWLSNGNATNSWSKESSVGGAWTAEGGLS